MQLCDIVHSLNCLTHKVQPFLWTPQCQASFDMLCLRLANTLIVQLPDTNKPYLLFTNASKFFYSGVLTQALMAKSNDALLQILTNEDPLNSVDSKHRTFNSLLMLSI